VPGDRFLEPADGRRGRVAECLGEQFVLGGEVVVDEAGAHAELSRDVRDARVAEPSLEHNATRCFEDLGSTLLDGERPTPGVRDGWLRCGGHESALYRLLSEILGSGEGGTLRRLRCRRA